MRHVLGFATGYGLLTVTGNEHKQMRKTMNPAFSLPNLVSRELDLFSSSLRQSQALTPTNNYLSMCTFNCDL